MTEVLFARNLSLSEVKQRFQLQPIPEPAWFSEWQRDVPEPSGPERQWLDQLRVDFLALSEHPLHEEIVKLVVVAPLLSLAGLCRPPFLPTAERRVEIALEDADEVIRGRIDVLVLHRQLWVTTIEAKQEGLDVSTALPQALFYMLNSPSQFPTYGLVTNGSHFIFIKLMTGTTPCYALSDEFSLRRQTNELYPVLGIFKKLAAIAVASAAA
jgi:hypothetical protein